ncbi:unnamed protein product [Vitrella brassicaformis CCMP3155]|uniref:Uncharacterized protein n=1 Tax=Vitrella brassicaformis (strain CCMP3155) TaxID=1169540 RepID=A0A0G4ERB6_VITBC|nr:unnamed protein product [Vitrella brassicaformis CCMP3155]|eukprot:CEM00808.1 unnamed protein product [Vitrella brassicaformis CCMP3155]
MAMSSPAFAYQTLQPSSGCRGGVEGHFLSRHDTHLVLNQVSRLEVIVLRPSWSSLYRQAMFGTIVDMQVVEGSALSDTDETVPLDTLLVLTARGVIAQLEVTPTHFRQLRSFGRLPVRPLPSPSHWKGSHGAVDVRDGLCEDERHMPRCDLMHSAVMAGTALAVMARQGLFAVASLTHRIYVLPLSSSRPPLPLNAFGVVRSVAWLELGKRGDVDDELVLVLTALCLAGPSSRVYFFLVPPSWPSGARGGVADLDPVFRLQVTGAATGLAVAPREDNSDSGCLIVMGEGRMGVLRVSPEAPGAIDVTHMSTVDLSTAAITHPSVASPAPMAADLTPPPAPPPGGPQDDRWIIPHPPFPKPAKPSRRKRHSEDRTSDENSRPALKERCRSFPPHAPPQRRSGPRSALWRLFRRSFHRLNERLPSAMTRDDSSARPPPFDESLLHIEEDREATPPQPHSRIVACHMWVRKSLLLADQEGRMMMIRSVRDPVAIHATWIGGHTEKTLSLPPSATLTGIAPPPAISPCQCMVSLGAVGGGVRKARGRDWEGTEVVMIGAAGSHRLMHLWMEVSPLGQIEATFAPLPLPCPVPLGPWSSVAHMSGRVPMRELIGTGGGDGGESDVMVDSLCEEIPRVVGLAGRYPSSAIQIIAPGHPAVDGPAELELEARARGVTAIALSDGGSTEDKNSKPASTLLVLSFVAETRFLLMTAGQAPQESTDVAPTPAPAPMDAETNEAPPTYPLAPEGQRSMSIDEEIEENMDAAVEGVPTIMEVDANDLGLVGSDPSLWTAIRSFRRQTSGASASARPSPPPSQAVIQVTSHQVRLSILESDPSSPLAGLTCTGRFTWTPHAMGGGTVGAAGGEGNVVVVALNGARGGAGPALAFLSVDPTDPSGIRPLPLPSAPSLSLPAETTAVLLHTLGPSLSLLAAGLVTSELHVHVVGYVGGGVEVREGVGVKVDKGTGDGGDPGVPEAIAVCGPYVFVGLRNGCVRGWPIPAMSIDRTQGVDQWIEQLQTSMGSPPISLTLGIHPVSLSPIPPASLLALTDQPWMLHVDSQHQADQTASIPWPALPPSLQAMPVWLPATDRLIGGAVMAGMDGLLAYTEGSRLKFFRVDKATMATSHQLSLPLAASTLAVHPFVPQCCVVTGRYLPPGPLPPSPRFSAADLTPRTLRMLQGPLESVPSIVGGGEWGVGVGRMPITAMAGQCRPESPPSSGPSAASDAFTLDHFLPFASHRRDDSSSQRQGPIAKWPPGHGYERPEATCFWTPHPYLIEKLQKRMDLSVSSPPKPSLCPDGPRAPSSLLTSALLVVGTAVGAAGGEVIDGVEYLVGEGRQEAKQGRVLLFSVGYREEPADDGEVRRCVVRLPDVGEVPPDVPPIDGLSVGESLKVIARTATGLCYCKRPASSSLSPCTGWLPDTCLEGFGDTESGGAEIPPPRWLQLNIVAKVMLERPVQCVCPFMVDFLAVAAERLVLLFALALHDHDSDVADGTAAHEGGVSLRLVTFLPMGQRVVSLSAYGSVLMVLDAWEGMTLLEYDEETAKLVACSVHEHPRKFHTGIVLPLRDVPTQSGTADNTHGEPDLEGDFVCVLADGYGDIVVSQPPPESSNPDEPIAREQQEVVRFNLGGDCALAFLPTQPPPELRPRILRDPSSVVLCPTREGALGCLWQVNGLFDICDESKPLSRPTHVHIPAVDDIDTMDASKTDTKTPPRLPSPPPSPPLPALSSYHPYLSSATIDASGLPPLGDPRIATPAPPLASFHPARSLAICRDLQLCLRLIGRSLLRGWAQQGLGWPVPPAPAGGGPGKGEDAADDNNGNMDEEKQPEGEEQEGEGESGKGTKDGSPTKQRRATGTATRRPAPFTKERWTTLELYGPGLPPDHAADDAPDAPVPPLPVLGGWGGWSQSSGMSMWQLGEEADRCGTVREEVFCAGEPLEACRSTFSKTKGLLDVDLLARVLSLSAAAWDELVTLLQHTATQPDKQEVR